MVTMDAAAALELVDTLGVVLVAAKGPVPRLTEAIAGELIEGSWWGHAKGHEIYDVLNDVTASPDVLVCRAVGGKVTLVHRRLWPALICAAEVLGPGRISRVEQEHTERGHHVKHETPFAQWADDDTMSAAAAMSLDDALRQLGPWTSTRGRGAPSHTTERP
jgi:hypothetical protein